MARICGWMKTRRTRSIPEDGFAKMRAELSSEGFACETSETTGLYVLNGGIASANEADLHAAICGRPRWDDHVLAAQADAQGNAHALLAAYRQDGADCLRHLRGDFALAIVDAEQDSLLLAIDRMGIRPLCYTVSVEGHLIFGSTTKLVRRHPRVVAEIDPQSVFDYVYFHFVPSPNTIHRSIYKLEPAQYVLYRDGKLQSARYWRPTFCEQANGVDARALSLELRDILRASVVRCVQDDRTGAFLSGGLDSSTVSGLLAEASERPTHAYTIGFAAAGYDEMEYARTAARHFGLVLHEYYVTPADVVEAIPRVARAYDEPFGNSSAVPALLCAGLARQHGSDVLLAGDGGDELFAGNTRYVKQKIFERYSLVPAWMRSRLIEPLLMRPERRLPTSLPRKIRSYVEQARLPMPRRGESYNYLHRIALEPIFEGDFLNSVDPEHPLTLLTTVYADAPARSLLNRMLYLDWKFTLADNDLRKVMQMCEAAGVAVRFPMLDEALVDFSLRVPPNLKIKGSKLRHFYKLAMKDFLPAQIIAKSKHGFGLPFGQWLKTSPQMQDLIYSSLESLKTRGIIRPDFIDTLIATHRTGHAAYYGTMIWILAMLEQWFQQHGR